ncbi:hemogen isoform X2 [Phasianus colchicus]|uniref:hemogen isoform X2 n=1 Tax=Phasianus colchicus TaxID=9054 RepID=UPI00129ECE2A|nr:hemogen isoform X2 [Phasianus colchicus]
MSFASALHSSASLLCGPGSTMLPRLRDRELLRKRRAEAEEKDSIQWALGEHERRKRQRRGQGARRGKGRERVVEPAPQPNPKPNPQPPEKEEPEPVSSTMMQQAESSQMDMQDLFAGVQLADLEGILASGSQSPLGEEDMLKLADEIQEVFSTSLEKNESDNDMYPSSLF